MTPYFPQIKNLTSTKHWSALGSYSFGPRSEKEKTKGSIPVRIRSAQQEAPRSKTRLSSFWNIPPNGCPVRNETVGGLFALPG